MNRYQQQWRKNTKDEGSASTFIFPHRDILKNGWLIVIVSLVISTLGIVYAFSVTPIYEANALIQIRRDSPLSAELQADIPASTEVEILRSRSILSRVVDVLQLETSVEPKLFPVLGGLIAGHNTEISHPGLFGHGGYVWGAEHVRLALFNVPDALLRKPFTLTVTGNNRFMLTQEEMAIAIAGRAGEIAKAASGYGAVEILVSDIASRPGAQFLISRSPKFQVVEQLQKSLAITEMGKQSNVIRVSLRGSNPELISRILNEIGNEYIRRQSAQKSEEARRALLFYDQQVEASKQKLQKLDARLDQVLRRHGTSDLSEEARALAQQSVSLQDKLADQKQKKVELLTRFAELHPEVITVTRHIQSLTRDLEGIDAKRRALAAAQQEIHLVNRDKQINSEMNTALVSTRQRLDALTLSNNANVRVVDRAEAPLQPVTLSRSVMIAIACLFGIVLGVVASMAKNSLGRTDGPREVESARRLVISAGISERSR